MPGKGLRLSAWVTVLVFSISNTGWSAPGVLPEISAQSFQSAAVPSNIEIPPELGTLEVQYRASSEAPLIVILQDAHAIVDAQLQSRKLIEYLQKTYRINLIALEGGEGALDATLFRTFPDERARRKVMRDYLERGELSGAEMAAVFGPDKSLFYGIEDWDLYQDNYLAYARAAEAKEAALEKLLEVEKRMDEKRKTVFSPELNQIHERVADFHNEKTGLIEFLKYFSGSGIDSAQYPHLSVLIHSLVKEESLPREDLDVSLRKMAEDFEKKIRGRLDKKKEMEFNERYRAFRTGESDAGSFLKFLVETGSGLGLQARLTSGMRELLGNTQTLETIKGTRLFEELEQFIQERKRALAQNDEQRTLITEDNRLFLLRALVSLELTHDQLSEYQKDSQAYLNVLSGPCDNCHPERSEGSHEIPRRPFGAPQNDILIPALEFYELALKRDKSFYRNLTGLLGKKKSKTAVVLAGGFHTRGFEENLKAGGYSYAVVMPKINSLDGHERYAGLMRGDLSYKDYLRSTFYDAFSRAATVRMVGELSAPDFRKSLKIWRDEVIRSLAKEGRVQDAAQYTDYIDLLYKVYYDRFGDGNAGISKEKILKSVEEELQKFRKKKVEELWTDFQSRLDAVTQGLKILIDRKELDLPNISALLETSGQSRVSGVAPVSVAAFIPRLAIKSEMRQLVFSGKAPAATEKPLAPAGNLRDFRDALGRIAGTGPSGIIRTESRDIADAIRRGVAAARSPEIRPAGTDVVANYLDQALPKSEVRSTIASEILEVLPEPEESQDSEILAAPTARFPEPSGVTGVEAVQSSVKTDPGLYDEESLKKEFLAYWNPAVIRVEEDSLIMAEKREAARVKQSNVFKAGNGNFYKIANTVKTVAGGQEKGTQKTAPANELVLNEARILFKLRDMDEVPRLTAMGKTDDNLLWIRFEGSGSESFSQYFSRARAADILAALAEVGEALLKLHARGIFHNDINPSNLFMHYEKKDWRARVIDFDNATEGAIAPWGYTPGYGPVVLQANDGQNPFLVVGEKLALFQLIMTLNSLLQGSGAAVIREKYLGMIFNQIREDGAGYPELSFLKDRADWPSFSDLIQSMKADAGLSPVISGRSEVRSEEEVRSPLGHRIVITQDESTFFHSPGHEFEKNPALDKSADEIIKSYLTKNPEAGWEAADVQTNPIGEGAHFRVYEVSRKNLKGEEEKFPDVFKVGIPGTASAFDDGGPQFSNLEAFLEHLNGPDDHDSLGAKTENVTEKLGKYIQTHYPEHLLIRQERGLPLQDLFYQALKGDFRVPENREKIQAKISAIFRYMITLHNELLTKKRVFVVDATLGNALRTGTAETGFHVKLSDFERAIRLEPDGTYYSDRLSPVHRSLFERQGNMLSFFRTIGDIVDYFQQPQTGWISETLLGELEQMASGDAPLPLAVFLNRLLRPGKREEVIGALKTYFNSPADAKVRIPQAWDAFGRLGMQDEIISGLRSLISEPAAKTADPGEAAPVAQELPSDTGAAPVEAPVPFPVASNLEELEKMIGEFYRTFDGDGEISGLINPLEEARRLLGEGLNPLREAYEQLVKFAELAEKKIVELDRTSEQDSGAEEKIQFLEGKIHAIAQMQDRMIQAEPAIENGGLDNLPRGEARAMEPDLFNPVFGNIRGDLEKAIQAGNSGIKKLFNEVELLEGAGPAVFILKGPSIEDRSVIVNTNGKKISSLTSGRIQSKNEQDTIPEHANRELLRIFLGVFKEKGFESADFEYRKPDLSGVMFKKVVEALLAVSQIPEKQWGDRIETYEKKFRETHNAGSRGLNLPFKDLDFNQSLIEPARSEIRTAVAVNQAAAGQTQKASWQAFGNRPGLVIRQSPLRDVGRYLADDAQRIAEEIMVSGADGNVFSPENIFRSRMKGEENIIYKVAKIRKGMPGIDMNLYIVREAKALLDLAGVPGIPRLLEVGVLEDGRFWLKMKSVVTSDSMESLVFSNRKVFFEKMIRFAEILEKVHAEGVSHNDIKLSIFFVDDEDDQQLQLNDWDTAGPLLSTRAAGYTEGFTPQEKDGSHPVLTGQQRDIFGFIVSLAILLENYEEMGDVRKKYLGKIFRDGDWHHGNYAEWDLRSPGEWPQTIGEIISELRKDESGIRSEIRQEVQMNAAPEALGFRGRSEVRGGETDLWLSEAIRSSGREDARVEALKGSGDVSAFLPALKRMLQKEKIFATGIRDRLTDEDSALDILLEHVKDDIFDADAGTKIDLVMISLPMVVLNQISKYLPGFSDSFKKHFHQKLVREYHMEAAFFGTRIMIANYNPLQAQKQLFRIIEEIKQENQPAIKRLPPAARAIFDEAFNRLFVSHASLFLAEPPPENPLEDPSRLIPYMVQEGSLKPGEVTAREFEKMPPPVREKYAEDLDQKRGQLRGKWSQAASYWLAQTRDASVPVEARAAARSKANFFIERLLQDAVARLYERGEVLEKAPADVREVITGQLKLLGRDKKGMVPIFDQNLIQSLIKYRRQAREGTIFLSRFYQALQEGRRSAPPIFEYRKRGTPRMSGMPRRGHLLGNLERLSIKLGHALKDLEEAPGEFSVRRFKKVYRDYQLAKYEALVLGYRDPRLEEYYKRERVSEAAKADALGLMDALKKRLWVLSTRARDKEVRERFQHLAGLIEPGLLLYKRPVGDEAWFAVGMGSGNHAIAFAELNQGRGFFIANPPDEQDSAYHEILLAYWELAKKHYSEWKLTLKKGTEKPAAWWEFLEQFDYGIRLYAPGLYPAKIKVPVNGVTKRMDAFVVSESGSWDDTTFQVPDYARDEKGQFWKLANADKNVWVKANDVNDENLKPFEMLLTAARNYDSRPVEASKIESVSDELDKLVAIQKGKPELIHQVMSAAVLRKMARNAKPGLRSEIRQEFRRDAVPEALGFSGRSEVRQEELTREEFLERPDRDVFQQLSPEAKEALRAEFEKRFRIDEVEKNFITLEKRFEGIVQIAKDVQMASTASDYSGAYRDYAKLLRGEGQTKIHFVGLGSSPVSIIQTMEAMDPSSGDPASSGYAYQYLPISGRQRDAERSPQIDTASPAQIAAYQQYLIERHLDPASLMSRPGPTIFVDSAISGTTLDVFFNKIFLPLARIQNIAVDQLKTKTGFYLFRAIQESRGDEHHNSFDKPPLEEYLRDNLRTSRYPFAEVSYDPDLFYSLINEDQLYKTRAVPKYTPDKWTKPGRPVIRLDADAALMKFGLLDHLDQTGLLPAGENKLTPGRSESRVETPLTGKSFMAAANEFLRNKDPWPEDFRKVMELIAEAKKQGLDAYADQLEDRLVRNLPYMEYMILNSKPDIRSWFKKTLDRFRYKSEQYRVEETLIPAWESRLLESGLGREELEAELQNAVDVVAGEAELEKRMRYIQEKTRLEWRRVFLNGIKDLLAQGKLDFGPVDSSKKIKKGNVVRARESRLEEYYIFDGPVKKGGKKLFSLIPLGSLVHENLSQSIPPAFVPANILKKAYFRVLEKSGEPITERSEARSGGRAGKTRLWLGALLIAAVSGLFVPASVVEKVLPQSAAQEKTKESKRDSGRSSEKKSKADLPRGQKSENENSRLNKSREILSNLSAHRKAEISAAVDEIVQTGEPGDIDAMIKALSFMNEDPRRKSEYFLRMEKTGDPYAVFISQLIRGNIKAAAALKNSDRLAEHVIEEFKDSPDQRVSENARKVLEELSRPSAWLHPLSFIFLWTPLTIIGVPILWFVGIPLLMAGGAKLLVKLKLPGYLYLASWILDMSRFMPQIYWPGILAPILSAYEREAQNLPNAALLSIIGLLERVPHARKIRGEASREFKNKAVASLSHAGFFAGNPVRWPVLYRLLKSRELSGYVGQRAVREGMARAEFLNIPDAERKRFSREAIQALAVYAGVPGPDLSDGSADKAFTQGKLIAEQGVHTELIQDLFLEVYDTDDQIRNAVKDRLYEAFILLALPYLQKTVREGGAIDYGVLIRHLIDAEIPERDKDWFKQFSETKISPELFLKLIYRGQNRAAFYDSTLLDDFMGLLKALPQERIDFLETPEFMNQLILLKANLASPASDIRHLVVSFLRASPEGTSAEFLEYLAAVDRRADFLREKYPFKMDTQKDFDWKRFLLRMEYDPSGMREGDFYDRYFEKLAAEKVFLEDQNSGARFMAEIFRRFEGKNGKITGRRVLETFSEILPGKAELKKRPAIGKILNNGAAIVNNQKLQELLLSLSYDSGKGEIPLQFFLQIQNFLNPEDGAMKNLNDVLKKSFAKQDFDARKRLLMIYLKKDEVSEFYEGILERAKTMTKSTHKPFFEWLRFFLFVEDEVRRNHIRSFGPVKSADFKSKARELVDGLTRNIPAQLDWEDPEEIERWEESILQNPEVWTQEEFLTHIGTQAAFFTGQGNEALREMVKNLEYQPMDEKSGSLRLRDEFHFQGMRDEGFSEDFIQKWKADRRVEPDKSILAKDEGEKINYQSIYQNAMHHFEIYYGIQSPDRIAESLQAPAGLSATTAREFGNKKKILQNLMQELSEPGRQQLSLTPRDLQALIRFFGKNHVSDSPLLAREILVDLENLVPAQKEVLLGSGFSGTQLTHDPALMMVSGLFPQETCQRPTEWTGHNQDGQLITRINHGQFKMGQVLRDGEVRLRSVLEVRMEDGAPVLLVERYYAPSASNQETDSFEQAIMEYADELGIKKVYWALQTQTIPIHGMSSLPPAVKLKEGERGRTVYAEPYRDTFSGRRKEGFTSVAEWKKTQSSPEGFRSEIRQEFRTNAVPEALGFRGRSEIRVSNVFGHRVSGDPDAVRIKIEEILDKELGFSSQEERASREIRVLDLGAGEGEFLEKFLQQLRIAGYRVAGFGIEKNENRVNAAKRKGIQNILQGDFAGFPEDHAEIKPGAFDIVTLMAPGPPESKGFTPWVQAAQRFMKPGSVGLIRLFDEETDPDSNEKRQEGAFMQMALLAEKNKGGLVYQDFSEEFSPELPQGYFRLGPLILTRKDISFTGKYSKTSQSEVQLTDQEPGAGAQTSLDGLSGEKIRQLKNEAELFLKGKSLPLGRDDRRALNQLFWSRFSGLGMKSKKWGTAILAESGQGGIFTIERDSEKIGMVSLEFIQKRDADNNEVPKLMVEIGREIYPDFQRQGYGTAFARAVLMALPDSAIMVQTVSNELTLQGLQEALPEPESKRVTEALASWTKAQGQGAGDDSQYRLNYGLQWARELGKIYKADGTKIPDASVLVQTPLGRHVRDEQQKYEIGLVVTETNSLEFHTTRRSEARSAEGYAVPDHGIRSRSEARQTDSSSPDSFKRGASIKAFEDDNAETRSEARAETIKSLFLKVPGQPFQDSETLSALLISEGNQDEETAWAHRRDMLRTFGRYTFKFAAIRYFLLKDPEIPFTRLQKLVETAREEGRLKKFLNLPEYQNADLLDGFLRLKAEVKQNRSNVDQNFSQKDFLEFLLGDLLRQGQKQAILENVKPYLDAIAREIPPGEAIPDSNRAVSSMQKFVDSYNGLIQHYSKAFEDFLPVRKLNGQIIPFDPRSSNAERTPKADERFALLGDAVLDIAIFKAFEKEWETGGRGYGRRLAKLHNEKKSDPNLIQSMQDIIMAILQNFENDPGAKPLKRFKKPSGKYLATLFEAILANVYLDNEEASGRGLEVSADFSRKFVKGLSDFSGRDEPALQEKLEKAYSLANVKVVPISKQDKDNIWIVDSGEGQFILKKPRFRQEAGLIDWEASVLEKLGPDQAAQVRKTVDDGKKNYIEINNERYVLYEAVQGEELDWGEVEGDKLVEAARWLADMHKTLKDFVPAGRDYRPEERPQVMGVLNHEIGFTRLEELKKKITERGPPSPAEQIFLDSYAAIETQMNLLRNRLNRGILSRLPVTITHGDFHQANGRYRPEGNFTGFDFEYASREARIRDLANAFELRFPAGKTRDGVSLAFDKVEKFLTAYHAVNSLTPEEIEILPDVFRLAYLEGILVFAGTHGKKEDAVTPLREQISNLNQIDSLDWKGLKGKLTGDQAAGSPPKSEVRESFETVLQNHPELRTFLEEKIEFQKNTELSRARVFETLKAATEWIFEEKSDLGNLPEEREMLRFIGEKLFEAWKKYGYEDLSGSMAPFLAMQNAAYRTPENFLRTQENLKMLLASVQNEYERMTALWTEGTAFAMHLRGLGMHLEAVADTPQNRERMDRLGGMHYEAGMTEFPGQLLVLLDNELLIQSIRELIPLLIKYRPILQETKLQLVQEFPAGAQKQKESVQVTAWEGMMWGLALMRDPYPHLPVTFFNTDDGLGVDNFAIYAQKRWGIDYFKQTGIFYRNPTLMPFNSAGQFDSLNHTAAEEFARRLDEGADSQWKALVQESLEVSAALTAREKRIVSPTKDDLREALDERILADTYAPNEPFAQLMVNVRFLQDLDGVKKFVRTLAQPNLYTQEGVSAILLNRDEVRSEVRKVDAGIKISDADVSGGVVRDGGSTSPKEGKTKILPKQKAMPDKAIQPRVEGSSKKAPFLFFDPQDNKNRKQNNNTPQNEPGQAFEIKDQAGKVNSQQRQKSPVEVFSPLGSKVEFRHGAENNQSMHNSQEIYLNKLNIKMLPEEVFELANKDLSLETLREIWIRRGLEEKSRIDGIYGEIVKSVSTQLKSPELASRGQWIKTIFSEDFTKIMNGWIEDLRGSGTLSESFRQDPRLAGEMVQVIRIVTAKGLVLGESLAGAGAGRGLDLSRLTPEAKRLLLDRETLTLAYEEKTKTKLELGRTVMLDAHLLADMEPLVVEKGLKELLEADTRLALAYNNDMPRDARLARDLVRLLLEVTVVSYSDSHPLSESKIPDAGGDFFGLLFTGTYGRLPKVLGDLLYADEVPVGSAVDVLGWKGSLNLFEMILRRQIAEKDETGRYILDQKAVDAAIAFINELAQTEVARQAVGRSA